MHKSRQDSHQEAPQLFHAEAVEEGFVQFIKTISKTFFAIPVGWLVLYALIYKEVPQTNFLIWVSVFFVYWLYAVYVFNQVHREGAKTSKHLLHINIILIMEGVLWGTIFLAFMGFSLKTDTWVAIFFAGIISVILPTYITYPKSFHVVILSAIISAIVSFMLIQDRIDNVTEAAFTVTMYLTALGFLIKPISIRVIEGIRLELENKSLTDQLRASLAKMSQQANTDALTGLLNRHALNKSLADLVRTGERRKASFSLLMMDVDHFKAINDTHGHDVGDKALQHVATCISAQLREWDLCARFGGEEFVVLLPATSNDEAQLVAERIRKAIESSPLEQPYQPLTISIGVASYQSGMDAEQLLKSADNGVYEAKQNGRNQVRQFQVAIS